MNETKKPSRSASSGRSFSSISEKQLQQRMKKTPRSRSTGNPSQQRWEQPDSSYFSTESVPIRKTQSPPPRRAVNPEKIASSGKSGKILGIGILVVLVLLLIAYLIGYFSYQDKFLPNTMINQVAVSGMTTAEAEQAILNQETERGITLVKKNGEEVHFDGTQFGAAVSLSDQTLQEAMQENHAVWFSKLFHTTSYTASIEHTYSEDALSELVKNYMWGTVAPTDAYIEKGEDGVYSVVPEQDGDQVDTEALASYTLEQMRNGNDTISLTDANCYLQASVVSSDLQETADEYNRLGAVTITYDFEDRTEVLDAATISDWLVLESDSMTVDREKATAWVNENLVKYDTYGSDYVRTFYSTLQGTLEISGGDYGIYGWQTDVEATVDQLVNYILSGESVTVEPEYSQTAYCRGTDDIGTSYAEVDITNQKVFVYKNGELVIESDCVTGMADDPERETPPGVYQIWYMQEDRVLGTIETHGYAQPVDYWIYFTQIDIGFHDLVRSEYGGDVYKTNGSHGCINLPLDVAAKMYETVEIGYPVIVIA